VGRRATSRRPAGLPERCVIIVAALLLPACGDSPSLPPLATDAVVLAFGDSLTYGTGAHREESYPAVLERRIGRKVVNAGVPGEVTERGLRRLPGALDRLDPQLLILIHGGNDILRDVDPALTEANLRAMIAASRARGVPVALVGVPELGLFLDPPEFYGRVAEDTGVPYEDGILGDLLGDNRYKSDHVHLNAAGYARLAEAVATLLERSGAL